MVAVRCDPAARNKKMNMRVVLEILPPGVQNAEETNLGTEVLWVGGDLPQRLRGRLEQDVVDHGLVLEGDDLDLRRHGEHHVEVGHVEQFRPTVLEPFSSCETLTLRATAITARVERDPLMAAIAAPLDVTAESGGTATPNRDHGAPPGGGQRGAMLITERRAEVAEHIRHFQPLAGHGNRASGGNEIRHARCDVAE